MELIAVITRRTTPPLLRSSPMREADPIRGRKRGRPEAAPVARHGREARRCGNSSVAAVVTTALDSRCPRLRLWTISGTRGSQRNRAFSMLGMTVVVLLLLPLKAAGWTVAFGPARSRASPTTPGGRGSRTQHSARKGDLLMQPYTQFITTKKDPSTDGHASGVPLVPIGASTRNATSSETGLSSIGVLLSAALVISLAMSGEFSGEEAVMDNLEVVTGNVLDALLPSTAIDLASVAVGEALAGVIGAASTFVLSSLVIKSNPIRPAAGRDVVADGDFFVASAAAFPLIQSTGLPPVVASVVTSIFASVPYELVKIGSRRRQQRVQEDRLLQQLLVEQQERERKSAILPLSSMPLFGPTFTKASQTAVPEKLIPVAQTDNKLDFVEIFSDILRWLEYGVLSTDFGGQLTLLPGVESAVYGVLATLSSQAYADLLYAVFGFGGEAKRDRIRSRTASEWSTIYVSQTLYAATLFGVYDAAKLPIKKALNDLLSGSYAGCLGSVDYNMCAESFLFNNPPPGPSFEAQARALFTTAYSIWSQWGLDNIELSL